MRSCSGNKNSLSLETEGFFGLFRKSIITIARSATKQDVNIIPAKLGRLYPRVVLWNAGFVKGIMFAAIVIMNQLTGHRKWSKRTLYSITVFLIKGTFGTVNHHFIYK